MNYSLKSLIVIRLSTKRKMKSNGLLTRYSPYDKSINDNTPMIIDMIYTQSGVAVITYLEMIVNG